VFTNDRLPRSRSGKDRALFITTVVGRGATIGANGTIVCGITIGALAFVGAGAVVTADVLPHALVVGNPARRIGWACTCGRRLGPRWTCDCGRKFETAHSGGLRERSLIDPIDGHKILERGRGPMEPAS
jgi:UDP-2-acetamido-3-amino-2,3-dideoxy-glucuronate N-acetyltransferase